VQKTIFFLHFFSSVIGDTFDL